MFLIGLLAPPLRTRSAARALALQPRTPASLNRRGCESNLVRHAHHLLSRLVRFALQGIVRRAHFKLRLHRPRERSCTLHRSGPVHPAGIRPVAVTRPMQRDVAEVPREFRNAGDFRLGYFRLPAEISGPACARSPRGSSLWRTFGDSNACKHLATSLHATATSILPGRDHAPASSKKLTPRFV